MRSRGILPSKLTDTDRFRDPADELVVDYSNPDNMGRTSSTIDEIHLEEGIHFSLNSEELAVLLYR